MKYAARTAFLIGGLLAGSGCTSLSAVPDTIVRYREPVTGATVEFQDSGSEVVYSIGDVTRTFTKCGPGGAFACLRNDWPPLYPFAVPTPLGQNQWDFDGRSYRVVDEGDTGESNDAVMIVTQLDNEGWKLWFLYAPKRGVLAFMTQPPAGTDVRPRWFVLEGQTGLLRPSD